MPRPSRLLPLAAAALWCAAALAQAPALTLESLPRPATPPPEVGPVVPAQVERWRKEAEAFEHGEGLPRDPLRAAELYCRAARHGDPQAQYSLAWMLTNARGIERDEPQAAHLFAAAAEQGHPQATNMAARLGTPLGPPPACLRAPENDPLAGPATPPPPRAVTLRPGLAPPPALRLPEPPLPPNAPPQVVDFVKLVAPEYKLEPYLVLAIIAIESNFDPFVVSPKNAQGLMQLIPETAVRFGVRNTMDPTQNIRGGMSYLRWLLAYFEGDITLAAAAYNAGERAVERYRGVPPYAETRHYVMKLQRLVGFRRFHAFDAQVTPPSPLAALIRDQIKAR
jgi:hypothetical protein